MNKLLLIFAMITTFSTASEAQNSTEIKQNTFTLKSNDIGGQMTKKQVFNQQNCDGENQSPQLSWSNPPIGTKSFAITMHDIDAPTGSGWWHWLVFDIPATTHNLPTDAGNPTKNLLPIGAIQSRTDYGQIGYGGPCPPEGHGFHQYTITIYALKVDQLGSDQNTNPATVGYRLNANMLEKASLVAYYKR